MANITEEQYQQLIIGKPKPKHKQHKEESMQIRIAKYLKTKHPDIIFHSDVASGMKLTMGQAVKNKAMQSGKGFPDMFIAEPNNQYAGLFLELKKEDATVWLKNGELSKNEHIRGQHELHGRLISKGYCARFAVGYDMAISIIESYLMDR